MFVYIAIGIFIGAVLGLVVFFVGRYFVRRRLHALLGTALYLIKVPREAAQERADFKTEINHFEQLLWPGASTGCFDKAFRPGTTK